MQSRTDNDILPVSDRHYDSGAKRSADADDTAFHLICSRWITGVAAVLAKGAKRYGQDNWAKGLPVADCLHHALRHILLYLGGDRSEPHLYHASCNLMFAAHFAEGCLCHRERQALAAMDNRYEEMEKDARVQHKQRSLYTGQSGAVLDRGAGVPHTDGPRSRYAEEPQP